MRDLVTLSMPWWQFAVRGGLAYIGLLVLMRLAGRRLFGEMSPFDIVVLIIVGGTMRTAIVAHDTSLLGPLIAVATIVLIDRTLAQLATHSALCNRLLEGRPRILARDGKRVAGSLETAGLPEEAFQRELRLHEIRSIDDVEMARLEPTGRISIVRRREAERPKSSAEDGLRR